jgi:hypothetical protein
MDEGRTWAKSFTPHHDGTPTEHGFASLFPMADGLGLIWLDGRAMHSGGPASGSPDSHSAGGDMSVRFARFDRSWTQVDERPVDLHVCECCPTAAAVTADGVLTAFRDRSAGEIRDIHVSRLSHGTWSEPSAVHADGWKIAACPVNGPALSARGTDVAIAWFTVKQDVGQVYAAFSKDAGQTFGAPVRVDEAGSLGRVDVELLPDGAALVTWIEFADQRAQFRARRIDRTGARSEPVVIAGIAGNRASGYPRVAMARNELVFAWTEVGDGGVLQVRTAVAPLPARTSR